MSLIGKIVGDLGGVAGATVGNPAGGTGDDFAINDLLFKVAPVDPNPYQRATAQFQKDQLDVGHDAGDQSLTGWWTRGQFSFHKGAGTLYYDTGTTVRLNENLTVLNHYFDGEGLDPFTTLGKVSCQHAWDEYSTSVGNLSYVSSIGTDLVVLDGTTVKYGDFNGSPSTYTPGGGIALGIVTSPTLLYAIVDNGTVTKFDPATATETVLYTGLTTTPLGIWYVKSRLVVADSDGAWYQLAPNPSGPPVAIGAGDQIFSAIDWAQTSCVSDSPGPILIGNSNRIFALTLDSTGAIPTLSAPIQVGELPPGETISAIAAHLGFVILVTGAGVRVAVLSDSGQLTYGPLLVQRDSGTTTPPATSVARYGTRAAVVVDNRIIEIDLSETVGQVGLEFAYTGRGNPFTGSETAAGVTTLAINTQIAWGNDSLWASTADYMEGDITTGYHRFAILEPKIFDSVRVHASGNFGTIQVFQVASDGSELSLYAMDVSLTHVESIPFKFGSPQEVAGLKFVLTPDSGHLDETPVLLGYQIRALPAPQRQELIKVPLMMKDHERRPPARMTGRTGSAWTRFKALKDLENSSVLVTFHDYRTNESGTAYIEQIEFTNQTPPTNGSSGWGGSAYVTLRKIS